MSAGSPCSPNRSTPSCSWGNGSVCPPGIGIGAISTWARGSKIEMRLERLPSPFFTGRPSTRTSSPGSAPLGSAMRDAIRILRAMPLAPRGTVFQLAVWNELLKIPWGETISYAELAWRIGKPSAVRAVGAANGANPIPVIIPCHRVIGSNGSLTGYGGGIERKQWLLAHEGRRLF